MPPRNCRSARRLRLEVEAAPGLQINMINDYLADGEHAWTLPSLAYGGEAWAVVRLRIPAPALEAPVEGTLALASFSLWYSALDGRTYAIQQAALSLPALPASAFTAIAEDERVAHRGAGIPTFLRRKPSQGNAERKPPHS